MTRFLAYTTPNRGHLYPLVPVLRELSERGHEVTVCTRSDAIPVLEQLGLDGVALAPEIEAMAPEDWRARNSVDAVAAAIRFAAARGAHELGQIDALVRDRSPDVLIVDPSSFGAFVYARKNAVPWAVYSPFPLMVRSVDVPPFGPGLAPGHGISGRVRDALLRRVVSRIYRRAIRAADELYARAGLPPGSDIDEAWRAAPLVLALSAEPFEYRRTDWPENVVLVGPCAWEPPESPPDWLSQETRPIVLVTASSQFQNDRVLIEAALEAFAEEPFALVVTAAAHDPTSFDVPANARIAGHLPHGAIIERAACVVCHGGMGTTQKALAAGVPVCAVPFMRDQFEVARRLEVCGAGTRLPAKRLSPTRLREEVGRAIECRDGAVRVRDGFAAAGGPSRAADALEGI